VDSSNLCTLAFQPEAYDSAAQALQRCKGYTVDVIPTEGEQFTATLDDLIVHDETGQWCARLLVWTNDNTEPSPDAEVRVLDIYDEIDRLEVV
jgi:hypothetical protein